MNWIDWLVDRFAKAICGDLDRQFGYVHECRWKKVFRWQEAKPLVIPWKSAYMTGLYPEGWYFQGHVCRVCGARK